MSFPEVFYGFLSFEEHFKTKKIKFLRFKIIETDKLIFEKEMYGILKKSRKKNKKF